MLARLPVNCTALPQDSPLTANFVGEVTEAADLMEAQLGEEELEETLDLEEESEGDLTSSHAAGPSSLLPAPAAGPAPSRPPPSLSHTPELSHRPPHISIFTRRATQARWADAVTRLAAAVDLNLPVQDPQTRWVAGEHFGAHPVGTQPTRLHPDAVANGLHVLEPFSGAMCGGLRCILEAGYNLSTYTPISRV